MNGLLKVFVAASLFAAGVPWASAGPVQNVKRQDSSLAGPAPTDSTTDSALSVTESSSATESVSAPIITSAPVTSETSAATTPSFTPFTGTAVFAPPAVSLVGAFMSENPEFRTRTFTVPTETATPTCNVLKCPLTYSNGVPIYGGSTSVPVFPSPFSENMPTPTDSLPAPSDSLPTPSDSLPTPSDSLPTPSDSLPTPSDIAPPSTETDASVSAGVSETSGADSTVPTASAAPQESGTPDN